MSTFRKTTQNEPYFVTLVLVGWIDLFSRMDYKDILVSNLEYCQREENLKVYEYVIMTNHLHMICLREGADLDELLGRFKSYTSKEFLKNISTNPHESRAEWMLHQFEFFGSGRRQYPKNHVWQSDHFPVRLYSPDIYNQKRIYIHQNPVRAGIVDDPTHYLFSSACPNSPLKMDVAY